MSIQLSKIPIRKIPNVILFVCKLISEGDGSSDQLAKKIAEKINIELEKKDCFPTDHAYKTMIWNEFCERGIMMNVVLFLILSIIFGYVIARLIVKLTYKLFLKVAYFLKTLFVRQANSEDNEGHQDQP